MASNLREAVYEASTPRGTREDVIDYYKQKYPGRKVLKSGEVRYEWQSRLADTMQIVARDRHGNTIKRDSIMRRFQKRGDKNPLDKQPSARHAQEYTEFGAMLPPIPPDNGFLVHGTVCVKFSDGDCEERDLPQMHLSYEESMYLVEHPDVQTVVNKYMKTSLDMKQPSAGECEDDGCHSEMYVEPL